jgi:single-stranded-DNA-specific exonuclease
MIQGLSRRWRLVEPERDDHDLARALGVEPLIGRLLARRGILDAHAAGRFLRPALTDLHDPGLLPGCTAAAKRIVDAVRADEPIVIYGDYDVDGVTATAILYHTLHACREDANVQRYIPHRIDEGYGINGNALDTMIERGAKLIVSVDCGITAIEPARLARQRGADLIVTDHHAPGPTLPDAYAIVHPSLGPDDAPGQAVTNDPRQMADDRYPFPDLCGAGLAYKLAWQITRQWSGTQRVPDVFRKLLVDLLPLAALGTVADVVPLVGENRAIVIHGLGRIKHTPFAGLNALLDASNLRDEKVDAFHIGFVLGPKLNACGRMGHAIRACKLLTDADPDQAVQIARFLNRENDARKQVERDIFAQARQMVRQRGDHKDDVRAIVLASPDWHPGVVGVVCSRLVEAFGRPTILLNTADRIAQGSGRSIAALDLHEALGACAEHLTTFGGHAMAAGLKIETDRIDAFRQALVEYANDRLEPADLVPSLDLDAALRIEDLTRGIVEQIDMMAPFGRGNVQPTFLLQNVKIADPPRTVGRQSAHLVIRVQQADRFLRAIAWRRGPLAEKLHTGQTLDLAVRPKLNHWNGRTTVEAEIVDLAIEPGHETAEEMPA